jgi:hypothetical protein
MNWVSGSTRPNTDLTGEHFIVGLARVIVAMAHFEKGSANR